MAPIAIDMFDMRLLVAAGLETVVAVAVVGVVVAVAAAVALFHFA